MLLEGQKASGYSWPIHCPDGRTKNLVKTGTMHMLLTNKQCKSAPQHCARDCGVLLFMFNLQSHSMSAVMMSIAKHEVQIGYKSACNTFVHNSRMIADKSVESVWQSCCERLA